MREQQNNQANNNNVETVSVADATLAAINHIRQLCASKNIRIDADLGATDVHASAALILPAVAGLLANAIAAMPAGGELSVTLVETKFQWELEVADSGASPSRFESGCPPITHAQANRDNDALPTILEFEAHASLHGVIKLAGQHHSAVQTFACPLGGAAHVLTVPKFAASKQKNQTRHAG